MPALPHLDLPLRRDPRTGHLAEVEQDSPDDVIACVEAVVRTRPGQREDHIHFGSPELAFGQMPISGADLVAAAEQWEPRARIVAESNPDALNPLLTRLRLRVSTEV